MWYLQEQKHFFFFLKKKNKTKHFTIAKLRFWSNNSAICDRWVRKWGLNDIGFGREKTTYCYFATATSLPFEFAIKVGKLTAKTAILITVADDLFDEEGSLDDLEALTKAVIR